MITASVHNNTWIFPTQIRFEDVSPYLTYFSSINPAKNIIFDLSRTITIHSSFIGFLLHAKKQVESHGGIFEVRASFTAAKIFQMLNIMNHLSPIYVSAAPEKSKKTA